MAFQYAAALIYKGVGVSCRIWSLVNPREGQSGQGWWQRAKAQTTTLCFWLQVLLNDSHHQGAIHVDIHLTLVLKAREDMAGLVCIHQDLLLCLLQLRADQQAQWLCKAKHVCRPQVQRNAFEKAAGISAGRQQRHPVQPADCSNASYNTKHIGHKINHFYSDKLHRSCAGSLPGCEAWWPPE